MGPDFSAIIAAIITGVAASFITSFFARNNESKRRNLDGILKISEFRQQWINELRNTMAEFQSYGVCPDRNPSKDREFYNLGTKIELLMNPSDPDYSALEKVLYSFLKSADGNRLDKYRNNPEYVKICQRILKREWERLKFDLNNNLKSSKDPLNSPKEG